MRKAITQALSERGPLSRGDLGQAVVELGYKSHAKNPLGSLAPLLQEFSVHGKLILATSLDGTARVWNAVDGQLGCAALASS